jgi:hypothetical protein
MKVELTQKQRIRNLAILHFVLTIIVFLLCVCSWGGFGADNAHETVTVHTRHEIFGWFFAIIFFILQPQFLLASFIDGFLEILPMGIGILLYLASIPIWSFCFSRIFIKLKDARNSSSIPQ